jgi:hypothetical protein
LVVACPKEQTEQVAIFTEEIMVAGMEEVMNPGLDADPSERVPVEVSGALAHDGISAVLFVDGVIVSQIYLTR